MVRQLQHKELFSHQTWLHKHSPLTLREIKTQPNCSSSQHIYSRDSYNWEHFIPISFPSIQTFLGESGCKWLEEKPEEIQKPAELTQIFWGFFSPTCDQYWSLRDSAEIKNPVKKTGPATEPWIWYKLGKVKTQQQIRGMQKRQHWTKWF